MDLLVDVLTRFLEREGIIVSIPALTISPKELVEMRCCKALQKIKAVIDDDSLDDPVCFRRIEMILSALEDIGSGGGSRHDFG